jgi:hypothetical protein
MAMNNHRVHDKWCKTEKKKTQQSLAANMVTGLNVNILTRNLVQTAFLGLQKAIDHVQKLLSEIAQKYF